MNRSFEAVLERVLLPWVDGVRRHSMVTVLAAAFVTLLAGAYVAENLEVNTDEDSLFSEELPHRVIEIEYKEIFPNLYENIVILVDAQNAEEARAAALALAAHGRKNLRRVAAQAEGDAAQRALLALLAERVNLLLCSHT